MFILRATQSVDLTADAVDKRGNPAAVQDPVWESSDPSVLAISGTGTTATASAVGGLGIATVTLTADADLGDGVSSLTGLLDIEVVAGDAAVFNISTGTPVEQADATTPEEPSV